SSSASPLEFSGCAWPLAPLLFAAPLPLAAAFDASKESDFWPGEGRDFTAAVNAALLYRRRFAHLGTNGRGGDRRDAYPTWETVSIVSILAAISQSALTMLTAAMARSERLSRMAHKDSPARAAKSEKTESGYTRRHTECAYYLAANGSRR